MNPANNNSDQQTRQQHAAVPPSLRLGILDHWMAQNPWHPRFVPYGTYLLLGAAVLLCRDWMTASYLPLYVLQCGVVGWLMWRYRKLLPELNLRFHWLAIPTGVVVAAAWLLLGLGIAHFHDIRQMGLWAFLRSVCQWLVNPQAAEISWAGPANNGHYLNIIKQQYPALLWPTLILRLIGMSLIVPLFEELFIRSLLLRSLHSFRRTGIGMAQLIHDLPLIGEWFMMTSLGTRASRHEPVFGAEFHRIPLGQITWFGFLASTFVFTVHHDPRDYLGCLVCAAAYCGCLWATSKKGLGPTVWAHGITNALLWWYTLRTGDWQFLP